MTGPVLDLDLALALRRAGLAWGPRPGDRFAVPDRDLDGEVFVISDMVVSSVDVPHGPPVLAFNGTTEWALDSLEVGEACWLPREDQLRDRLRGQFLALARPEPTTERYVVTLTDGSQHDGPSPEVAYARALLAVLGADPA